MSLLITNRSGTIVDGTFGAVFLDQYRVVCEAYNHSLSQCFCRRVLYDFTTDFIDNIKHALERLAHCLIERPACQSRGYTIDVRDAPFCIGCDHTVANTL